MFSMKSAPACGASALRQNLHPGTDANAAGENTKEAPGSWFLVYTKSRLENVAVLNLEHQGFATYLPQYKRSRPRTGQADTFEHLFPRYVFFRPVRHQQSISAARSTRGVVTLVSFGGEPAQVSDETVRAIRDFEQQRNETGPSAINPFQPGTEIRLRNSALDGLKGLVKSVSAQRIHVLIELLGGQKVVAVGQNQLELA